MRINYEVILIILLVFLPTTCLAQAERWVYRYSGVTSYGADEAFCLVYGSDGNIYAAGTTKNDSTNQDFTVISLTNSGSQRWMYKHKVGINSWDEAYSIVYGDDTNIYACGSTDSRFTIISLSSDSTERWLYKYPVSGSGLAWSICYGADNNIYATGYATGPSGNADITIISLTDNGAERWVYQYNGPGNGNDEGTSITYGTDNNIYVVGTSIGNGTYEDLTVIALTDSGSERWVYRYNGPLNYADYGSSVLYGFDGKIYAIGSVDEDVNCTDAMVICLADSGDVNWIYRSPISYTDDRAYDGVCGAGGNLYLAGDFGFDIPSLLVISVSDSGTHRWEYIDTTWGFGRSIEYGDDGNIYTCGITADNGSGEGYFTVYSYTDSGSQRWIYKRHWWGNYLDIAHSVVYGLDGNIYAAGQTWDITTGGDFTVIGLSSGPGVNEVNKTDKPASMDLTITPSVVCQKAQLHIHMLTQQNIDLKVYDITGREISVIVIGSIAAGKHIYDLDVSNFSSGVYFVKLKGKNEERTKKILIIR